MDGIYIRNYIMGRFDREMFLKEYISFLALVGTMRKQVRDVYRYIKPTSSTYQVHTGYLYRGSPRMPRPSPCMLR